MEEALRIVKTSGSIINNSGRIQTLNNPLSLWDNKEAYHIPCM